MSDFGKERIVDRLLAHLEKNGSDENLRELAGGIRRGEADMRDSLSASPYSQAMRPGLLNFGSWYEQLSESDRAEWAERCQHEIDELNRAEAP